MIKISRDALYELIYETIIDRMDIYLDIPDRTKIGGYTWKLDWETGTFLFAVKGEDGTENPNMSELDLDALMEHMPDTTPSMYQEKRYRELTRKELRDIQESK